MSKVSSILNYAVHPYSVRIFIGVWALFLADQIRLNYNFFGTSWPCWDYMLISGTLAFMLSVGLASQAEEKTR